MHVVLVISFLVCFLAEIIIPFVFSLSTHSRLVLDRDVDFKGAETRDRKGKEEAENKSNK